MNKKVWVGFAAVFVTIEILEMLVNFVLLGSAYQSTASVWRPDMNSKMWIFHLVMLFQAFFFAFIFSKGYENKGVAEGVRYGTYVGIWLSIGKAYGTYAMIAIPYSMALQWFIYGVVEYVIAGIVLALVFKPKAAPESA